MYSENKSWSYLSQTGSDAHAIIFKQWEIVSIGDFLCYLGFSTLGFDSYRSKNHKGLTSHFKKF